jgi:class 3 adenylate cyclase/ATP/maltotriose-dependent transcriptional regulator MalT
VAVSEHITVLFTDLVGSTELQSALAPEAADELRNKHFSALRQAIAASGGTEVKNLGDGIMVVFPAASSALGCAVAMQQLVHRDNAWAERPLGLRVGLSSGEATKEGDDYFGDPVIEAARLCAKAEAGQILATNVAKVNAGRRSSHAFNALGELELKGLPDPVETVEVAWVPLGDNVLAPGRVPLPVRLRHAPGVGVVGRQDELATLDAAAKRVASGEGRELVFIAGEPGQGKTTLVAEFARRAHEARMTVLLGRCDEDVGAPYRPFHELLSHLVSHMDETILRSHISAQGGELDRMVPALRQRLGEVPPKQSTDAETERYLLYAAVAGLLEIASTEVPVVLVLDDLHWADKPSLQLLRHLVTHSATQRLLLIGTYRDAELLSSHPLEEALAGLHREPTGVSTINLGGLEDTGVIAFMEAAAGHELDDAGVGLAHQLYRETDGNPFYVAEMLRHLSESGAIVQDSATGRWVAAESDQLSLPHSVRTVIGTRVSRLGDQATKVLSTASVIGRDFDVELLCEVTGVDEDDLLDLLDAAERATVVHEVEGQPGRYTFSHALIQHTLYEDLNATRRTRMHRQVGEAIERLHPSEPDEYVGELARHFSLATKPTDVMKAIAYSTRAGDAALKALAPDDGVRYFSQALELCFAATGMEPNLRVDLLIALGTAQRQAGIPAFRETLLEAARGAHNLGDSDRMVAAALANSRGYFSSLGQIDSEKVEVLEAAINALPEADSLERARLLATLCSELQFGGSSEECLALADEAKAMARRLGDGATLLEVFTRCSPATAIPSRLAPQLVEIVEYSAAADNLGDPLNRFWAATEVAWRAFRSGQFELADERLAVVDSLAARLQQPAIVWLATCRSAARALSLGDLAKAEEVAAAALEVGTSSGQPDAFDVYGIQLMGTRLQQGRFGEMASLIAEVAEQNPAIPAYTAALAVSRLEAGDEVGARHLIERAAAESFVIAEDSGWLDCMVLYARVVIDLGLHEHANTLLDQLAPFHDQVPHNGYIPHEPVATFLGALATVLGRYKYAELCFKEAENLNTRGGMRFAEAHTKMLWGRMLRLRGDDDDAARAQAMLIEARELAINNGYGAIERHAAAELSKIG